MMTNEKTKIYVIIPVYNEEQVIGSVTDELQSAGYKNIIVVDDGSSDNTFQETQKYNLIVIRHSINRGKGAAVKTGMEAAKILGAEIAITFDGDGQHDPKDIAKMVKLVEERNDVVLGTRLKVSSSMPFLRLIANHIGNFFTWLLYGLWVTDSQSGFRAFSKKALHLIDTKTDRYEYDSEVIREIYRNRLSYAEIPIEVRYTEYSLNKKNRQSLRNGIKTLLKMLIS